jgi:glycine/D-amino acid oxidase-like deaminating enzyme
MAGDVVIIGAGIVGASTAYFLAREGVSVTVLDSVGVAAGASGRNNGLVEHPYDRPSVPLFDETVDFLHGVLGDAMPEQPVGALLLADDEAGAKELLDHYAQFPELRPALLTPREARVEEPLLADGLWACMLQTGYPISPLAATQAVAEMARRAGAEFVVPGIQSGGSAIGGAGSRSAISPYNAGAITGNADLARCEADAVVVATGASTAQTLGGLIRLDAVEPLWGVIVLVHLPQHPRHPIIEGTVTRGLTTGKIEHETSFTLLDSPSWLAVGSTLLAGVQPEAAAWSQRLLDRGTRFVPSIARARVEGTIVCARPKSFDNRPLLGRVPGHDRIWLGSGHGGRGMSLGAASGRLLAEAILSGSEAGIPAELSARRLARS